MRRILWYSLIIAAGIVLTAGGCRKKSDSDKIVIKAASVLPKDHPSSKALDFFKTRLAELSDNKVDLQLFLNSQLGGESETIEMTQQGNIQMIFISSTPLAQYVPEVTVLSMPFLFEDSHHQYKVMDGKIGQKLADYVQKIGLKKMCFFDAGSRNIMTKDGPIETPDDLDGMKIRVMGLPLAVDSINALGASAIPMSQGEVYTALQTGVLDGWENNPSTALTFKMYETGCDHFAHTKHFSIPDWLLINKAFYDNLPPRIQTIIDQAADETTQKQRQLWSQGRLLAIDKLKQAGMVFNDIDRKLFENKVAGIYDQYYKKHGPEFENMCKKIKSAAR